MTSKENKDNSKAGSWRLTTGSSSWLVIYTMPRSEKKVNERLMTQGIRTYLPLQLVTRQWSDRKKRVEVPLINSYVFVKTTEKERSKILATYGVVRFVYYLGRPAIVREEELEGMKEFLRRTQGYRVEISLRDKVEVKNGPLEGQSGEIVEISKHKLKLKIEELGMSLVAEVDRSGVRKV